MRNAAFLILNCFFKSQVSDFTLFICLRDILMFVSARAVAEESEVLLSRVSLQVARKVSEVCILPEADE